MVLKTVWELLKRVWPLLLLILFRKEAKEGSNPVQYYEWIIIVFSVVALLAGLLKF